MIGEYSALQENAALLILMNIVLKYDKIHCTTSRNLLMRTLYAIRLIYEFSITGSIARQPLLMADQACNCWFFFISNKFNGIIFNMECAIT